jgi:isoleucyl-tRNA synthetase
MFEELRQETIDERELGVLRYWQEGKLFERSIEHRKHAPAFTFYDGPPFATGLPHYGHLLAGTIKDVIPRYKTMKGYYVPRRFGWDCHGLPVEQEIEKSFNLTGASVIEQFGIANFNEECRKIVMRYTSEWRSTVFRMGRWVDFDNYYRTMDRSYMESVWWVFNELYDRGLIYEGFKVVPYSAKLGTPLSNFEASENYKDVDDPSLTVMFTLKDEPQTSLLIWTTTPWTLISNLAIMVGPEIEYVKIKDNASGKHYILAKARLEANFPDAATYAIVESFKGSALEGKKYVPLFSYFADRDQLGAFRVILDDNVTIEDGTGLVHTAPAFGEADFYACQRAGIELVCPVDNNCRFTAEIPEYEGLFVKDADKDIIRKLKKEGHVFKHETLRHRYPFCWRSDTPLIYRAVRAWYVAVEKIKDAMLRANQQIHWVPDHIKFGRFGKWLEGARDWNISRNRYWGTPIPLWRAEDGTIISIGTIADLEKRVGKKLDDIHRHLIDDLTFVENGKTFKRITEVFDCWFDTGSMPYAQIHYPFENREFFENNFPADFIGEGIDQTRGWFYTLTIIAAALFDKPAFKNVIVNGIILAEDGAKMSKRLRNYPDPNEVIHKYGADAVRLYMLDSPVARADDLCFSERGVELVLRQVLIPLWNAYSFFITYARIYKWTPPEAFNKPDAMIDRWILSLLNRLIKDVEDGLDAYDLSRSVKPFVGFVDQLTNWYIRRSRRRFWEDQDSPDRQQAFATLYQVLIGLSKIAAPFIPFITESIYSNLRTKTMPESVHLCDFPSYDSHLRDIHLEEVMAAVQTAVSLGHSLRKEHKLKVRQPLPAAHIVSPEQKILNFLAEQQHLIADELNVKAVDFSSDEKTLVVLKAKPNFRVLGKKVGKLMKAAQTAIEALDQKELAGLRNGQNITINLEGEPVELTPEDVQVDRIVHEGVIAANEGAITLALDTALNDELIKEGLAREIVNKINTMRREGGFDVTDRIRVKIQSTPKVSQCYQQYKEYIDSEVLSVETKFENTSGMEWDLNGEPAVISLVKVK